MPGARLYRVGSPFNAVELPEVDTEQSADVMYLAHIDHPAGKLLRRGHTDWAFADVTFGPTIAVPTGISATATSPNTDSANSGNSYFPQPASYVVTAVDDDSGQESRASAAASCTNDLTLKRNFNTISWAGVTGAERYRVYKQENTAGYGWIGDTTSLTFRDDNIAPDLTDSPPLGNNPFVGAGNYPSTVTLFEQRLLWARTRNKPNGVWGSKSGDYENHDKSRPLRDDDAIAFALVAQRVNAVNQLVPLTDLLGLGSDGVFRIGGGDNGGYLTGTPVVRRQSGRGSSRLNPIVEDNIVFFKTSVGNEVRTIGYSFDVDGFKTNDVTIFSPHLFDGHDILWWAYAQQPRSILYVGRDDGKILAFTWEAEQQVWGWTLLETDGFPFTGCVIPEAGEDRLYVGVRRTINGQTRRYIERLASHRWDSVAKACYLDCAVRRSFYTKQSRITGLNHLEGRTVNAVVDGNVVSGLVVTGGVVTLPSPLKGNDIVIGLPYEGTIETLPLVVEGGQDTNQGRKQQAAEAVVRVVNMRGIEAGPDEEHLFAIKPRSFEPYGVSNELKTGDYLVQMAAKTDDEITLLIRQREPLPFTLTAAFLDPVVTG